MGLRDTLRKAAGLLVELPPEAADGGPASTAELSDLLSQLDDAGGPVRPTKTVAQIVRDTEGPNLDQITLSADARPVLGGDGEADFAAIYAQATLPPAPFSAEQMLEMLGSLPPELPLETKRQTVRVTMTTLGRTVGCTPETVVADASRKLAALNAYVEALGRQTAEVASTAESEIAALQAQIEERRVAIQQAQSQLGRVRQQCDAESDRLDDVLEFFSLDVPPSKHAG